MMLRYNEAKKNNWRDKNYIGDIKTLKFRRNKPK